MLYDVYEICDETFIETDLISDVDPMSSELLKKGPAGV
jgi:hypothetical protein